MRKRLHTLTEALCVMESIRALARAGHVVACTIHQPRQAIVAAGTWFIAGVTVFSFCMFSLFTPKRDGLDGLKNCSTRGIDTNSTQIILPQYSLAVCL